MRRNVRAAAGTHWNPSAKPLGYVEHQHDDSFIVQTLSRIQDPGYRSVGGSPEYRGLAARIRIFFNGVPLPASSRNPG
jgi:hypothetical protein